VTRLSAFAVALAIAGFPAVAAHAQAKLRARDSADIQDCVKTKGPEKDKWEGCIGIVAEPCFADERTRSTADETACAAREQAVWDDILNETFRRLREKLDDAQKDKLRDMQRAWIVSRDKTCTFYWDYFQGTMATPMTAMCVTRETGRRALFLLGFLTDADSK
jgi:uncharacterized protein YecT (DUF1311 family)